MKKTAFVTGADGFIGSHLVQFLRSKNWNVIGGYWLRPPGQHLWAENLHFVECDLRKQKRLQTLIDKYQPNYVFHLAAQSLPTLSWSDPVGTFKSNIMGSLYLLEALRNMKRPPVVVTACSSAEYGHVPASAIPVNEEQPLHPLHPYGISKVCLDLLGRQYFSDYGLCVISLRLFNTTGPGKTNDAPSDFVRQLIRIKKGFQEPVIHVGNLEPRRAFLDVSDAVRGFYLAATKGKPGSVYNLCAANTRVIGDMLQTAIRLSGVCPEIRPVARLVRPSDERIIFGDTTKIRRDTGWKPLRSIEQTLQSMLAHWDKAFNDTQPRSNTHE